MKLLFFISTLRGGGAERVMATLCNEFAKSKDEIHLATDISIPFAYNINPTIQLHDLERSENTNLNPIQNRIKILKRVKRIVKEVRPDIIISFMYQMNAFVLVATIGMRIPVIASEHNTFDRRFSFSEYIMRIWINRIADKITILSQHDYEFLGSSLPTKVLIPNPLSFPIYKGKKLRNKTILAAGSLDRWKHKGFDSIIKVWGEIAIHYPDWTLEIAGNGSKGNCEYLMELCRKNDVEGRVHFIGFQKNMEEVMRVASIFVLPSRWEGFGMVLTEAMSQGCPCVSFDCVAGPNEIIDDGVSGLLVENQNLKELEKSIIRLIHDKELRLELSSKALKEVEKFLPENIIKQWRKLFSEVLEKY